eukprot:m.308671 g.308671  ORF g.308671 m.308671 type:complete len:926 (+) comp44482_c0_seq1:181-2958(+)
MFWNFNPQSTTAIDGLLSKDDCTLAELLDEDDVLQECKANNAKLINFLVDPGVIGQLIGLVTTEPDESTDEKTKYKHPNTACNLLTAEVEPILDKLMSDDALLAQLWSFVETDHNLDALLASYFSKVIATLLKQKTVGMLDYIRGRPDAIQCLLGHINTSAIMDLIVILTSCCENPEQRAEVAAWLDKENLVQGLIALIQPEVDEARQGNAAQALCDITRMSRENAFIQGDSQLPDVLLQALEDPDTVSILLENILATKSSDDGISLINGINILLVLIERQVLPPEEMQPGQPLMSAQASPTFSQMSDPPIDMERLAPLSPGIIKIVQSISLHMSHVHALLQLAPSDDPIASSGGTSIIPLGNVRLQLVRLIAALLLTGIDEVQEQLVQLKTMNLLLDLFFEFELNNFLHIQVEQAIVTILASNRPIKHSGNQSLTEMNVEGEEEGVPHFGPLFFSLLNEGQLLQRLARASNENDTALQSGQRRKGFMGHLTKLAEQLARLAEEDRSVQLVVNQLPEEERLLWNDFMTGPLTDLRQKNELNLGGKRPMMPSFDESGDDDDFTTTLPLHRDDPHYDPELQQTYVHYQTQQMSNDFMETFGFDEEQFPGADDAIITKFDRILYFDFSVPADEDPGAAALFEACCQQRIKPYNESDDDDCDDDDDDGDDGWEEKELTFTDQRQWNEKGKAEDDDDDDETVTEDVEFEWTPVVPAASELSNAGAMDVVEVPEWAREPDEKGGSENWADFSKLSEVDQKESGDLLKGPAVKYTTEVAFEMMNKESTDGAPPVEMGSEDESDDSDERSGSYNISAENEAPSVEVEDPGDVPVKEEIAVEESPLPESEQAAAAAASNSVGDQAGSHGNDEEEELEDNFVFLSSSGLMKSSQSQEDSDEQEIPENRQESDLEMVRLEARKAMDLYDEATSDNQ